MGYRDVIGVADIMCHDFFLASLIGCAGFVSLMREASDCKWLHAYGLAFMLMFDLA
jgi:hypothetical protein